MKKIIGAVIVITLTILFCTGCEVSNTELANSLDGNMTRLVYSVGYLDSVSTTDIQDLTMNTSYFAGSSYNLNNTTTTSGVSAYRDANYRSNVYNANLTGGYANYVGTANSNYNNLNSSAGGVNTCTNCNSPLATDNTLTNNSIATDGTLSLNTGNATTSELGGLCNDCTNLGTTTATQNLKNVTSTNTTAETTNAVSSASTNYVDMALLESSASDLNEILLSISQKRGIIMLYCTDLRSGNIALSADDKSAISEYITIIKETINYLNNNSTALTAHVNNIKNVAYTEGAQELINAKLIRANEVLKTRYAKLDTCIDSLDAIIAILQRNIGVDYSASYLNNSSYTNTTLNNNTLNNSSLTNQTTETITENANGTITDNKTTTAPSNNLQNNYANNGVGTNTINNSNGSSITPSTTTTQTLPSNQTTQSNYYNGVNGQHTNQTENTIVNYNYAGSNNGSYNLDQMPNTNINSTLPNSTTTLTEPINTATATNNTLNNNSNNLATNATTPLQNSNNTQNIINGLGSATQITTNKNPRGIGIQPPETSPITGITYNSNSVNVPKPGTLISSISLKNETTPTMTNPINTDEFSKDNGLKLVDNKNEKKVENNNIEQKNDIIIEDNTTTAPNQTEIIEEESNIQTTPLTEQITENITSETPSTAPKPLIIKELGAKQLNVEPIYSAENTFKLLPFNPN